MTSFALACARSAKPGNVHISPGDEGLIASVGRRDQEAFTCLLNRHVDAIHRYIYRLTGSDHDADDLTQETFLRVWQKAGSYNPRKSKPTTWLYRIAHNLCVDQFRKPRHEFHSNAIESVADSAADQETALDRTQQLAALQSALDELPHSQRSALLLCQVQGFSNREAAQILNITVRALESLLARARRNLRDNFKPERVQT